MRNTALIFLTFFCFSCSMVYFEDPQPKGIRALSEIPQDLQGVYITPDDDTSRLEITKKEINYYLTGSDDLRFRLNKNLVIKRQGNDFYVNLKGKKSDKYWMLYIMEKSDNMLFLSSPELTEKELEIFQNITDIRKETSENPEAEYYLLNPSFSELNELRRLGFFSQPDTLYKKQN